MVEGLLTHLVGSTSVYPVAPHRVILKEFHIYLPRLLKYNGDSLDRPEVQLIICVHVHKPLTNQKQPPTEGLGPASSNTYSNIDTVGTSIQLTRR